MTLAVICFSWIPLTVSANDGGSNPLLFSSTWRAGALTTYIIALLALYRPLMNRGDLGRTLQLLTQSPYRRFIAMESIRTLDYALFALSTRYIDVAATAIAFEIWPITVMLILARLYHRKIPVRTCILAPICFLGFLSVAAGEQGGLPELQDTLTTAPTTLLLGFGAAILAACATSLSAFALRCGTLLSQDQRLQKSAREKGIKQPLDRFGTIVTFAVCNAISIPVSAAIGLTIGGPAEFPTLLSQPGPETLKVTAGGALLAGGAIMWQAANARTQNLGINALNYLTPTLSLSWLWMFSQVGPVEARYLLIGAAAIIAANIMINRAPAEMEKPPSSAEAG